MPGSSCPGRCGDSGPVAPQTVSVNQQFDVDIVISGNTTTIGAMDFRLDFDKAKLQVIDYKIGNFLHQSIVPAVSGADETTCINWANNTGVVGAGLQGSNNSSTGTVLTVTFKALSTGTTSLNIASSSLKPASQSTVLSAGTSSTTIIIEEASASIIGDFNEDENVDFEDLMILPRPGAKHPATPAGLRLLRDTPTHLTTVVTLPRPRAITPI